LAQRLKCLRCSQLHSRRPHDRRRAHAVTATINMQRTEWTLWEPPAVDAFASRPRAPYAFVLERLARSPTSDSPATRLSKRLCTRSPYGLLAVCFGVGVAAGLVVGSAARTLSPAQASGIVAITAATATYAHCCVQSTRGPLKFSQAVVRHASGNGGTCEAPQTTECITEICTTWTNENFHPRFVYMSKDAKGRWNYTCRRVGQSATVRWFEHHCTVRLFDSQSRSGALRWSYEVPPQMQQLMFPQPLPRTLLVRPGMDAPQLVLHYNQTGSCVRVDTGARVCRRRPTPYRLAANWCYLKLLQILYLQRKRVLAQCITEQHVALVPDVCTIIVAYTVPLHGTYGDAPSYCSLLARLENMVYT
jgi:hypothetical protein